MNREEDNKKINIMEIWCKLWAYKFMFVAIIFIFVCSAVFYINNTSKLYTATSIFIPEKKSTSNDLISSVTSQAGGLRQLAGIANPLGETEALIERFEGREFVLKVVDELKLADDKFFNSYNPTIQEPSWRAKLKSLIIWKSSQPDPAKIAEWNVLKNFKNNIRIKETKAGAMTITVVHPIPERAANIANHIMSKIIAILKSEKDQTADYRLNYLSERLADSLINVGNAEEKLNQFLRSNSTIASSSFYKGSIFLEDFRTQRDNTNEHMKTINVLLSYARRSSPTFQDYVALRNEYPSLDQPEFRRILGISETISAWSWPSVDNLMRTLKNLQDRARYLDNEILKYEKEAKKYATSSKDQNNLTRDLRVAEAAYRVLVEQVKSQSLLAGFSPDTSQIIAAADAPIAESKPKKILVLALAVAFGFFVSAFLALMLSWNSGVFYSSGELLKALNPKFHHKIRRLEYYRTSSLQEVQDRLIKRPAPWLKKLFLETSTNRGTSPIIVADTTNFHAAAVIARLLAARAHEFRMSVAYLNLSKTQQVQNNEQEDKVSETKTNFEAVEISDAFTEYNYRRGKQNIDWLFSKSFQETLDFLNAKHDLIIFSASSDILDLLHAWGKLHETILIIHASKRKTTYENIQKLHAQGSIKVAVLS